jgi:hypothetical protein
MMATQPLSVIADTFEAFAIISVPAAISGQTRPLDTADTLAECLSLATDRVAHKGHFMIRHTDALTGKVMLSFYVIKRKSNGERRWRYAESRVVHDLYAEHLFDLDGGAL